MSHRSPCVPAYRKFCSAWWIASGSPRSRPRRRWDRGPAIPACILLAYRGSSKRTTSRHSSQLPAVFSAVRPLFQPGLDSPKTIKNTEKIYDSPTFVHSFVRLSHSRLLYLSLFQGWTFRYFSVLNLQRNFRNIREKFQLSLKVDFETIERRSRIVLRDLIMEWNGSIYQTEKNLHRLALPSTFPFLAPLYARPVPGASRCDRLAVTHEVQIDVVPVRAAKALRPCWTGNVGLRPHWMEAYREKREKCDYLDRLNVFDFV